MTNDRDHYERIVRYLDGTLSAEEHSQLENILQEDPNARDIFSEIAEQAILFAELHQLDDKKLPSRPTNAGSQNFHLMIRYFRRQSISTLSRITATISLLAASILILWFSFAGFRDSTQQVEVIELTGVTHYFNAKTMGENRLQLGSRLQTGDLIESRSCDAWISLHVAREITLTIAGHSSIRVLLSNPTELQLELLQGSIWFSPSKSPSQRQFTVITPTMKVCFQNSMLNIQTSPSESIVRVDLGKAQVQRLKNSQTIPVIANHQCYVTLNSNAPLASISQPIPTEKWESSQMKGTEVLLGTWLPATENEPVRLGATPLLWPLPDNEPVTLYATAIAAWRCSERPVQLRSDSTIRFRGRTQKPQTVRLGFSVQKMYGVFAGKFEIDIPASSIHSGEDYWTIALPLSDFRPLHPHLAASPEGLELTDVYALTIANDAGLEITRIELLPPHK